MFISLVFNSKTGKLIKRFCGNDKQEVEVLAREQLYNYDGSVLKNRRYKVFEKKVWPIKKLKNCLYKDRFYERIYLQMFIDWDGLIKININCNGANMNDYESVQEAFSYIKICNK